MPSVPNFGTLFAQRSSPSSTSGGGDSLLDRTKKTLPASIKSSKPKVEIKPLRMRTGEKRAVPRKAKSSFDEQVLSGSRGAPQGGQLRRSTDGLEAASSTKLFRAEEQRLAAQLYSCGTLTRRRSRATCRDHEAVCGRRHCQTPRPSGLPCTS